MDRVVFQEEIAFVAGTGMRSKLNRFRTHRNESWKATSRLTRTICPNPSKMVGLG